VASQPREKTGRPEMTEAATANEQLQAQLAQRAGGGGGAK
jgi:hypothetical protein